MKHKSAWLAAILLGLLVLTDLAGLPRVEAQSGGGYDLTWSTMDGGGGASSGGAYSLGGTVGQPDVGVMTGSVYTPVGGFWGGVYQAQRRGTSICPSSCVSPEERLYLAARKAGLASVGLLTCRVF